MSDVAPTTVECVMCRAELDAQTRFCPNCGSRTRLAKASLPPPDSLPPAPFGADGSAQAAAAAADPLIGAIVADRYRILGLLGRGGMGVVYKVEHAKIGKIMALKLLTGELARSRDTVRRFKREALMVSRLSHPNTVQVFDFGSSGGLTYLAMEYLSGRDLGAKLEAEGPLGFTTLAPIVLQACASLAEAHSLGIVHRDLKPENLFLVPGSRGDEVVKVLDFGLAKLREARELNDVTSSGTIVGTPYYMSPEQVRGEDVDGRGDVYALGALLYTCLTGVHAFEAPNPVAVLTRQLTSQPDPPYLRYPSIPIGVSNIVMRALEKDPARRYQTVTEFAQAIEGELRGTSLGGYTLPESGVYRRAHAEDAATRDEVESYERSLRRKHNAFLLGLGLSVLALGYLGVRAFRASKAEPAFEGREREPNQEPATATAVVGGRVRGRIGERFQQDAGDRDFFRFKVDGSGPVLTKLRFSGLPNFATRLVVFQEGAETPLLRLARGTRDEALALPQLRVPPGSYLVLVEQDRDPSFEGEVRPWFENVSDDYEVEWTPNTTPSPELEIEPNEEPPLAGELRLGEKLRGSLSVLRDVDVVCETPGLLGARHFRVSDLGGLSRSSHAVLLVTPLGGPNDKIPVRLHPAERKISWSERDAATPQNLPKGIDGERACVRLELTVNPWAPPPLPIWAPPGEQQWQVELVNGEK